MPSCLPLGPASLPMGLLPFDCCQCFPTTSLIISTLALSLVPPPPLPPHHLHSFPPSFLSLSFCLIKGNVGCVQSSVSVEQAFSLCACVRCGSADGHYRVLPMTQSLKHNQSHISVHGTSRGKMYLALLSEAKPYSQAVPVWPTPHGQTYTV